MKGGDLIYQYRLDQAKHQCKKRKIWIAQDTESKESVLLGITLLNPSYNNCQVEEEFLPILIEDRELEVPLNVFTFQCGNFNYFIQVKAILPCINPEQWLSQIHNKAQKSTQSEDFSSMLGVLLKIIKKIEMIYEREYCLPTFDINNIVVFNNEVKIFGLWCHIQGLGPDNALMVSKNLFMKQKDKIVHNHYVVLQIIKIAVEIFSGNIIPEKLDKEDLLEQINAKIHHSQFKKVLKEIVKQTDDDAMISFLWLGEVIQNSFKNISKIKSKKFTLKLPLSSKEPTNSTIYSKWFKKININKDDYKLLVKLGNQPHFCLSITTSNLLTQQNYSILYTEDNLPPKIKHKFKRIKTLYDFICQQKQKLSVKNNLLFWQQSEIESLNTSNITSSSKINNSSVEPELPKEKTSIITLRQCKFYQNTERKLPSRPPINFAEVEPQVSPSSLADLEEKSQTAVQLKYFRSEVSFHQLEKIQWLAVQFYQQGNLAKASKFFNKALDFAQTINKTEQTKFISLFHNLALFYQKMDNAQEAVIYCMKSLKISTQDIDHLNATIETLNLLINLLSYYFADYEEALYYIREGGKIISQSYSLQSARFLNTAGIILIEMKKYQESVDCLRKAQALFQLLEPTKKQLGYCILNKANTLSFLFSYKEALQSLKKAGKLLSHNAQWKSQCFKLLLRLIKFSLTSPEQKVVRSSILQFIKINNLSNSQGYPSVLKMYQTLR